MAAHPPSPSQASLALLDRIPALADRLKHGQPGAREEILGVCGRLLTELRHPSESMLSIFWSQPSHLSIIRLGVDLQLFHALRDTPPTGATSAAIAAKCAHHPDPVLVSRMLRHLAAMGTVREVAPDTFAPTELCSALAEPSYQDFALYITDDFQPVHQALPSYFRQHGYTSPDGGVDGPFQHAKNCKGLDYFAYFQKFEPEMGRRFASMMDAWSKGRPRWFFEDYYPIKERLISGAASADDDNDNVFLVDVGGGTGHDVEGLRNAFSSAIPGKLVLQDLPETLEHAQVGPGVQVMAHDFTTEQPVKGARAYYLHSIIQDWNDATNTQILESLVPALKPGYSKVLVNDYVVPDEGAHWAQTCLDWELMASLGARHRTQAEHKTLYEGAGLRIVGIWNHAHSLDSLIELELA